MNVLPDGNRYVFLKHDDGVAYALCGSLNSRDIILGNICAMFLFCGTAGLIAAVILGSFLANRLARPLQMLAHTLKKTDAAQIAAIPAAFVERRDELGTLARIIKKYQEDTKDYVEREKSFVSAASHELRTPLAIIANGLELLETQIPADSQASATLGRLSHTAGDMAMTVSALLRLARGEKQPLEKIDPDAILLQVLRDMSSESVACLPNADDQSPKQIHMRDGLTVSMRGKIDETWGQQGLAVAVFRNLLENAVRHSGKNEICIDLAGNALEIRNKANFATEDQAKSGFGLMIARRACSRMGWLLVRSGDENETIFRVEMSSTGDDG